MFFFIPLIPKMYSQDWQRIGTILNATLASLANQRSREFKALLFAHDVPDNMDTRGIDLEVIEPDWTAASTGGVARRDKRWKRALMGAELRRRGGGYGMILDADDLVSDRLVDYVHAEQDPNGYIIENGYLIDYASRRIAPLPGAWPEPFYKYCGSCAVFHMTPEELPVDRQDETPNRWHELKGHPNWRTKQARLGRPLRPFPFPAGMYVQNTGENMHDRINTERNEMARTGIATHAIADTTEIEREFGLTLLA
jgi:hypothetical protein